MFWRSGALRILRCNLPLIDQNPRFVRARSRPYRRIFGRPVAHFSAFFALFLVKTLPKPQKCEKVIKISIFRIFLNSLMQFPKIHEKNDFLDSDRSWSIKIWKNLVFDRSWSIKIWKKTGFWSITNDQNLKKNRILIDPDRSAVVYI